jgi:hypothetical protein
MTTMVSSAGTLWALTDATASLMSFQRSVANAAMTTETVGKPAGLA